MAKFSQNFMNVLAQAPGRQQQRQDVSGMMSQQAAPMSRMQSGLAQALGMDTRTYDKQASDEIRKIKDPQSYEGILQALQIQNKYTQDPQAQLANQVKMMEVMKLKEADDKAKQEGVRKSAQEGELYASIKDKNPELARLALSGVEGAREAVIETLAKEEEKGDPSRRYKIVGNGALDTWTGKFLINPNQEDDREISSKTVYNPETKRNEIQWFYKNDPNTVVKTAIAEQDEKGQSVASFKRGTELITQANAAGAQADSALSLARELEEVKPEGGVYRTIQEYVKGVAGAQDKVSRLYQEASRLRTSRAVANLPRGPASDKDVALVLQGEPPANADGEYLAQYARGVSKLLRREAKQARDNSYWLDKYGDEKGFTSSQSSSKIRQELAAVPEESKAIMEQNASPQAILDFEEKYKFNYFDAKQELSQAEDVLRTLGRGI